LVTRATRLCAVASYRPPCTTRAIEQPSSLEQPPASDRRLVALPAGTATDEHRTIVDHLARAKRLLVAENPEDLKASVGASREACKLLRKMRPPTVNSAAR
jgi:hypothetical protein